MPSLIAKYVATLAQPFQSMEKALWDLYFLRNIYTSKDDAEDMIGRLVGQARLDPDNEVYRRYLFARVATDKSKGTIEDVISVAKLILNDSNARIVVQSVGPATATLTVADVAVSAEIADILVGFERLAVSAGVRLVVISSESVPADTFTLDIGPGLDVGHLASGAE